MYKYGVIINLTERTKLDNFQTYENQIKKKKKKWNWTNQKIERLNVQLRLNFINGVP